ncbi:MAG: hypothetical protein JO340_10585 [Acidobacteriaceae bacterium]|nr:hypothetical protein [Acidobacteriaceae bacterium]
MSAPLVPSPLDYLGRRRFALYPPVKHAGPNEWLLGTGSWSEVQVVNVGTGREIWVPRQYVRGVSGNGGRLVVELNEELQLRAGAVEPRNKRVIEMPLSVGNAETPTKPGRAPGQARVVGIRLDDRAESTMSKAIVTLGAGAIGLWLLAMLLSALERM